MARVTGTQALSTTALQLPSQPCTRVNLRNNDASIAMLIGWNSTTQSFTIPAGGGASIRLTNLNQLWAKSASGTPTMSYITE
jgi:hypothetical protein